VGPSLHGWNAVADIESPFSAGGAGATVEGDDLMHDAISWFKTLYLRSNLSNHTDNLMTDHNLTGRMRHGRFIGLPFVYIAAAYSAVFDLYQDVAGGKGIVPDSRSRHLFKLQVSIGIGDEAFHFLHNRSSCTVMSTKVIAPIIGQAAYGIKSASKVTSTTAAITPSM
jgi:hypothetical protein